MNKKSPTYRIIAQITAFVVLMSTLLPAGFAMGEAMMEDCDMRDSAAPVESVTTMGDCCSNEHAAAHKAVMSTQDCQCTLKQTEATPPVEGTHLIKQLQQWSLLITEKWDRTATKFPSKQLALFESISKRSTPLFLLNSVFLN